MSPRRRRPFLLAAGLCTLAAGLTPAAVVPSCEIEARTWRGSSSSTDRMSLERCAARSGELAAAAVRLTYGLTALEGKQYAEAVAQLQKARPKLTLLHDYVGYFQAAALYGLEKHAEAVAALEPVWKQQPVSPLAGRAALLAARAYLALNKPGDAARTLEAYGKYLAQPDGDYLAAEAWKASGDTQKAARLYAKVYFEYPQSAESASAGMAWRALGYQPEPKDYLLRTQKAGPAQALAIRNEILEVSRNWPVADRELALVRAWSLEYRAKRYVEARKGLATLQLTSPVADAERSYHLYQTSRRLNLDADRRAAFERLERHHAGSPWYLEALLSEGYRNLTDNNYQEYEPIYRACVDKFERTAKAPFCHWKLSWSSYFRRRDDAESHLRDHLVRFPQSEKANAALYFLGRLAEQRGDVGSARAYYEAAVNQFPNTYYSLIGAERLGEARLKSATANTTTVQWIENLRWPNRVTLPESETAAARVRRERASLLQMAGLDNYAEAELRTGAREEQVPLGLAVDLAEFMSKQGQVDKGIRYVKGLLPGYLYFPWDKAGERLWRAAFPLPFYDKLLHYSTEHGVDPFVVAGLIRQESEFNPKVVSVANAHGLTQILPGTGRELSRRVGLRGFQTKMLYDPAVNLRLGTFYIKTLLNSFGGRWEDVLAAYNGGPSRVKKWRTFGEFREQAEFIETIPFDETREYVQSVLRNAAVYRKLYEGKPPAIHSTNEPRSTDVAVAKPAPAKPAAAKPVQRAARKKAVPKRSYR